jgi:uncharacterized protein YacL (UPF0231 family)
MITVDESKFKGSDVTLYDKDGNVIGTAKNVLVTEDDDLCKGHKLTDSESLLLSYYKDFDRAISFLVELPLRDKIKLRFMLAISNIKNKLFPSYRI